MSEYLDFDCKNCGRHRVESNGICEKCNFDNIHNEFAQPILECLEHGAGTCRNENLIEELRAELARRTEALHYANTVCMEQKHELAHRDASLLTEGEQKEILSYIQGNYDRDKIPTWLLDLIDGITRRDEIIARLKEDVERLAYHCVKRNHFEQYTCQLCDAYADTIDEIVHDPDCDYKKHRQLMKEIER